MTEKTAVFDYEQLVDGYLIFAPLSEHTQSEIHRIQDVLAEKLGASKLWIPRGEQLHITFAHIVSPDDSCVYEEDRSVLFSKTRASAVRALEQIVPAGLDIPLTLAGISASPYAIIAKWRDGGEYDKLRKEFTTRFELPEPTKRPPEIVHTTIARFRDEINFDKVRQAIENVKAPKLGDHTTKLLLGNEKKIYMQKYTVLDQFPRG